MATSVTISPTLGHAPLFTQAGVGASPGYDAIDLRRIAEAASAFQEGVFDATGWNVTQRGAGANMTVDVAANVGLAVVTGDSVTAQSRYVIPPHSAVANLDIGSNATGNPRIDQVVLQVRDTTHDGSGSNDVRVLVLAGTATSGATLDNRTGAASLPVSAIRLADILVANGAASITNAVIRDRRVMATAVSSVSSLPSSPADGQECYYVADATAGVVWHLKYRAAASGSYKWENVGGAPLSAQDAPLSAGLATFRNSGTTYTVMHDAAGANPPNPLEVTLPLAGDYDIRIEGHMQVDTSNVFGYCSYAIGAVAASDAWCITIGDATGAGTANGASATYRHAGVASGAVVAYQGRVSGTAILYCYNRVLSVTPVRVG